MIKRMRKRPEIRRRRMMRRQPADQLMDKQIHFPAFSPEQTKQLFVYAFKESTSTSESSTSTKYYFTYLIM
jgi:hypothetical protein